MINYAKYENVEKNVLTNAFLSIEKKQKKLLEQVKENEELLKFLSEKIASAFTVQPAKFYTTETSPILKKISDDFKELPQAEQEELKAKLAQELGA